MSARLRKKPVILCPWNFHLTIFACTFTSSAFIENKQSRYTLECWFCRFYLKYKVIFFKSNLKNIFMNFSLNNCLLHLYLFVIFSTNFYSWKYHCWYLLVLLHDSKTTFGLPVVFSVAMQSPFDLFFSWNVFPSVWGIFIQIARAGGFTFFPLHITAAISPELSS